MLPDYSQIAIGPPEAVLGQLTARLGELNMRSANMRMGLTHDPDALLRSQQGEQPWQAMRLLWATRSPDQARRLGERLHAWDRKLYLDNEAPEPQAGQKPTYYAYALVR